MLFSALCFTSQAEEPDAFIRPAYNPVLRQNENWSGLKGQDAATTGDIFDPIKHVTLSEDGDVYASFGGQARFRYEDWSAFGFNDVNDDTYFLTRLRFHGDVHFGENFRVFAEGKSAQATDRNLPGGRRGLDMDTLALQQAFADIVIPLEDAKITLRTGRQMFVFGKQRLVSPLDWSNTMRAWDGFSGVITTGNLTINGFWTQFVPVDKSGHNESNGDEQFYGVYATAKSLGAGVNADFYWLARDRGFIADERDTFGARLFGNVGETAFDYDVEAAYQSGTSGTSDVDAYMIGAQLGYALKDTPGKPRFFIGFDLGSGDDNPADSSVNTFDQMYPLGHAYLGFIDVVGRQNIIDYNAGFSVKPIDKMTVIVTGHIFRRHESNDALYNAGGGVVRAGGGSNDKGVGSEIDLLVKYALDRHTVIIAGYSHFFAGDFIGQTGTSDDIDFFYTGVQFTF